MRKGYVLDEGSPRKILKCLQNVEIYLASWCNSCSNYQFNNGCGTLSQSIISSVCFHSATSNENQSIDEKILHSYTSGYLN
jgi:hypothetical protein